MPEDQKQLIVDTVRNFDKFSRAAKKLGLTETVSFSRDYRFLSLEIFISIL